MIELLSSQWSELSHAYGAASDIPKLLTQLEDYPEATDYRAEPYFSLWSALWHQGDVYTASFAAVPHILKACKLEPAKAHWSLGQLIT